MKIKTNAKPYFAAYPLKVITGSRQVKEEEKTPILSSILSIKTKAFSRPRVSPMQNPYKEDFTKPELPRFDHRNGAA